METILQEILINYLTEKQKPLKGNYLAEKLRKTFPTIVHDSLPGKIRYKVLGSPGKGNWADCPWIAILDRLITDSPETGYYVVFLFKADMSGVYLSINQGVTEVKEYYKRNATEILELRAQDLRAKLNDPPKNSLKIELKSKRENAKLYEAGNVIAKYYSIENLPSPQILKEDVKAFLKLYEELAFNDPSLYQKIDERNLTVIEKKQYGWHFRVERCSSVSKKVKDRKGYVCEACTFTFTKDYGDLGQYFIEVHHLKPISSLEIGRFELNIETDFAVLCSNCHSMIHKLEDVSLQKLKEIVEKQQANSQIKTASRKIGKY